MVYFLFLSCLLIYFVFFLYCRPGRCRCRGFWTASFMAGHAAASAWMPTHKRTAPLAPQGETSNRDNRPTKNPSTTTQPGHKKSSRSFEICAAAALRKTASSSKLTSTEYKWTLPYMCAPSHILQREDPWVNWCSLFFYIFLLILFFFFYHDYTDHMQPSAKESMILFWCMPHKSCVHESRKLFIAPSWKSVLWMFERSLLSWITT